MKYTHTQTHTKTYMPVCVFKMKLLRWIELKKYYFISYEIAKLIKEEDGHSPNVLCKLDFFVQAPAI